MPYADGNPKACSECYLQLPHDSQFEQCMQAIDCKMTKEMRVIGHDNHSSAIVSYMQQMIPHHINAVNMAKVLIKLAGQSTIDNTEDLMDILWTIINTQMYQVHKFRNYLGGHKSYQNIQSGGSNLNATSVGEHCSSSGVGSYVITPSPAPSSPTGVVARCVATNTNFCTKVNLMSGESGYYEFATKTGSSPTIIVQIGKTYTFDQRDPSNWYHPLGFAYYPDGAHGHTWGGAERDEVEGAGELLYKINGAATTCPDAGDTGLDCYEPEFFYPRGDWMAKTYSTELTITQAMADKSHGGVIYYFCHIHSKMSGKIIIQNADGSPVTQANGSALPNPTELSLYPIVTLSGEDYTCGTAGIAAYAGSGAHACSERFVCGNLDTEFEKCLQAIDCKMNLDMKSQTTANHADKVAIFMEQMIPHHLNAVYMSKLLLNQVSESDINAAMDDGELHDILREIIVVQTYQIHQFRNYLQASQGGTTATLARTTATPSTEPSSCLDHSLVATLLLLLSKFLK
jgi:uncharacterized protein (DUF305 family)